MANNGVKVISDSKMILQIISAQFINKSKSLKKMKIPSFEQQKSSHKPGGNAMKQHQPRLDF